MIYFITKSTAYLLFKMFFSLQVKGLENVPKKGPFIIASNHASNLDPIIIGGVYKGRIHFMAKEELFKNKFFAWYLRKLSIFPLKRATNDSRAMRETLRRLKAGCGIGVFPEGSRTDDGNMKEPKVGVSVLSFLTNASVIPCYIGGTYEAWPSNRSSLQRAKLTISFAKPLSLPVVNENNKKLEYYEFAQKVMLQIKALKQELLND